MLLDGSADINPIKSECYRLPCCNCVMLRTMNPSPVLVSKHRQELRCYLSYRYTFHQIHMKSRICNRQCSYHQMKSLLDRNVCNTSRNLRCRESMTVDTPRMEPRTINCTVNSVDGYHTQYKQDHLISIFMND